MTQQSQFEKLLELMEQNPEIARGIPSFGSNTKIVSQFWENATIALNSLGLPNRTGSKWRKVIDLDEIAHVVMNDGGRQFQLRLQKVGICHE